MKFDVKSDPEGAAAARGRRNRRSLRRRRSATNPDTATDLARWIGDWSPVCTFMGLTLGVFVSRKFLILPLAVAAIAVQDTLRAALKDAEHRLAR